MPMDCFREKCLFIRGDNEIEKCCSNLERMILCEIFDCTALYLGDWDNGQILFQNDKKYSDITRWYAGANHAICHKSQAVSQLPYFAEVFKTVCFDNLTLTKGFKLRN